MRIRLVHKTLENGRFHVFTSPDMKGLHISRETLAEAQREAIAVVDAIVSRKGLEKPVIEFVERAAAQAA